MTLVSAFDDDALGELDAVGVVEALRSKDISRTDVIDRWTSRPLRSSRTAP